MPTTRLPPVWPTASALYLVAVISIGIGAWLGATVGATLGAGVAGTLATADGATVAVVPPQAANTSADTATRVPRRFRI